MTSSNPANSLCVDELYTKSHDTSDPMHNAVTKLMFMDMGTFYPTESDGKCILNNAMNYVIGNPKLYCHVHDKISQYCFTHVMLCNIVGFRGINYIFSHKVGNALISFVADYIRSAVHNADLARLYEMSPDICEITRKYSDKFQVFYMPHRYCKEHNLTLRFPAPLQIEKFWKNLFGHLEKNIKIYVYSPPNGSVRISSEPNSQWESASTFVLNGIKINFAVSDTEIGAVDKLKAIDMGCDKTFDGNVYETLNWIPSGDIKIPIYKHLILKFGEKEVDYIERTLKSYRDGHQFISHLHRGEFSLKWYRNILVLGFSVRSRKEYNTFCKDVYAVLEKGFKNYTKPCLVSTLNNEVFYKKN